jgi:DNA-3-methyladenine glycosylase II
MAVTGGNKHAYDRRSAVRHLRRVDPRLAKVIDQIGPYRPSMRSMVSPFDSLMEAITYQQLSGKAAATIHGRVRALFSDKDAPHPEALLALPGKHLRGAGLSRNKVLAMQDLAARTLDGTVPDHKALARMSDAEVIERLTQVRGIGRWTVEMLLISSLDRPDVLPVTDLAVRKGFRHAYGMKSLPAYSTMERTGRSWAPYRSVATWYLWRLADTLM